MTYSDDNLEFTHFWVDGFGWENTIYIPSDFERIEFFGQHEQEKVFMCYTLSDTCHIVRGVTTDK